MSLRVLTLTGTFLLAATATAADWPQWRGPNRDGVSQETGLLKKWPAGGPAKVWTAENLGTGFGTPSVAAGKIFGVGTRDGKDGVWALKEADGKELWFTPFAEPAKTLRQANGPASTPTFHDGKVYAVSGNGTLGCFDAATGKEVWHKSYTQDFGSKVPTWGYSDSVLVDGDNVICAPGSEKAAVVALKAATGDVVWKTEIPKVGGGFGYSSPIKATVGGVPMYIVLLGQTVGFVGVAPDTGKLLWQYAKDANGTADIPTPIVRGDLMWCASGYPPAGGAALVRLIPEGKDKVSVKEVKFYESKDLMNHHGGMVLVGDHVYFGHGQNQGYPVCVEFKTGEIKWGPIKKNSDFANGDGSAAVLCADGLLYFRYQNGTMVLIEPSPDQLKVVSSFKLSQPNVASNPQSWPHPVIANGKLYIRDQNMLYCYNVKAASN